MNKKVFITGASSGIGEYLAYSYSKLNYCVGPVSYTHLTLPTNREV